MHAAWSGCKCDAQWRALPPNFNLAHLIPHIRGNNGDLEVEGFYWVFNYLNRHFNKIACFSLMWEAGVSIMTVSVWMDQEQLRGRPALSASFALSVSLQGGGESKTKQFWFYWFNDGMFAFNIFRAEIEKKSHEGWEHLSRTAAAEKTTCLSPLAAVFQRTCTKWDKLSLFWYNLCFFCSCCCHSKRGKFNKAPVSAQAREFISFETWFCWNVTCLGGTSITQSC